MTDFRRLFEILLTGVLVMCVSSFAADDRAGGKSPLDELPPWIRQVATFGQRADFSHDGKRILFIEKTFGDAYEVEIATGRLTPVTHHYYHEGYTRALYLANGDILLSGARKFDASNPMAGRSGKNAELWVLSKDLTLPPVPLDEHCSEGPAVSRTNLRIAWTEQDEGWIFLGEIVYEQGTPRLVNKKKILDAKDMPFECNLETQNFRPPDDRELIFSAYMRRYRFCEVMGLNLETGEIVNYSKAPNEYDEPEGIFPDGEHTLVECDRHNHRGTQHIDIYKLALDGSARTERLTNFANYRGYKASNPVLSDDGRYMAFQFAKYGDLAGVGRGILLFDLEAYEQAKRKYNGGGANYRQPTTDEQLQYWLENMVWYHHFSIEEMEAATGLSAEQIKAALERFDISPANRPAREDERLLVLPYPGGRHPRDGFLEGAVNPQRETKLSVFTPWDDDSYVVVDVPEAVFSNLGLIYLAHHHEPFPTVWEKQGIGLEPLEWNRREDGSFGFERRLPNGIAFGAKVTPEKETVRMELWLRNATDEQLTDLKVQNCVMTARAKAFEQHTNKNKVFREPYVACRSEDGSRWIITAWENCVNPWANPDVPCFHSDPQFDNCEPGQTVRLAGWLSFYEGTDIEGELGRIEKIGWRDER